MRTDMIVPVLLVVVCVAAACSPGSTDADTDGGPADPSSGTQAADATGTTGLPGLPFPPAPEIPTGPLPASTVDVLDRIWRGLPTLVEAEDLRAVGEGGDVRAAWLVADILRFAGSGDVLRAGVDALEPLTGVQFRSVAVWVSVTDHLIAWDIPAPPGYADYKRRLFTAIDPRWEFVFAEPNGIDERYLSWGGVFIDDRPLGDVGPCPTGCIPALDDPAVTDAGGGSWYPDEGIVFGVEMEGETRAYPKNIMEVHEMVNDTLGGRRFGMPYCTLCGSAQMYLTDEVEGFETPVLRTTGLLSRSNKVMYDLISMSVFDTFTGEAVAGPMFEAGVALAQSSVVTTTWGEWRSAHPDTTIVAQDGGIGRSYPLDPLGGRDDNGPIFPIGDRDLRLPVQEQVLGVILPDGTPIAFPASAARERLTAGGKVAFGGVELVLDGGGLRATLEGEDIASHQAFWFAWSQFHPDTLLWEE